MGFTAHFFLAVCCHAGGHSWRELAVGVGAQLMELIEKTVEGLGYEFVELERAGGGLLRVTLDAPQTPGGVGLDDCERVSRQLTRVLEVEGVDYDRLEVSSPGLDRRLSRPRDFARFAGQQVLVQLSEPLDGKRRLRGRLVGVSGAAGAEQITLELLDEVPAAPAKRRQRVTKAPASPPRVVEVALAAVDKARLVPQLEFGSKR
jgi:ribosome maturation factor RimP